jgi:hypothetical protein
MKLRLLSAIYSAASLAMLLFALGAGRKAY